MSTGFLRRPLPIVIGSGWSITFNFWTGSPSARVADVLTGLSAAGALVQANVASPTPIAFSTGADTIVIDSNAVTITADRATTAAWAAGDYDFALRVFDPEAEADRWVVLSNPAESRVKVIAGAAA